MASDTDISTLNSLIKTTIDKHIVPGIAEGLGAIALAYLGCVVLGYGLEVGYTIAVSWSGQRTIARMRRALYRHALGLAQSFFDSQPTGKLLTRLTSDLESLGDALAAGAKRARALANPRLELEVARPARAVAQEPDRSPGHDAQAHRDGDGENPGFGLVGTGGDPGGGD